MAGDLLRDAGYDVIMLGPDVPTEALPASAAAFEPHIVCLSATMPSVAQTIAALIEAVRGRLPAVAFILGGHGLKWPVGERPEVAICQRVSEVVESADALVRHAGLN
jgi:methylmalonyl-CoA mutase cobalamin-binding subunit